MRTRLLRMVLGTAFGLFVFCGSALAQPSRGREHVLPLFISSSNTAAPRVGGVEKQGFIRVINHSNETASVRIVGVDDAGVRKGPITLTLGAKETIHLNTENIEGGDSNKGLPTGLGTGTGNWRLHLSSRQDIEPLAYVRTKPDGFLTSLSAVAPEGRMRHRVVTFNPGSNTNQLSWLRLINLSDQTTNVTISGLDDAGEPGSGGQVTLSLPPQAAQRVTSPELESGSGDLMGHLGDGAVKWQLAVTADQPILVMSLMDLPTGHLSNLSAPKRDYPGAANVWKLSFTDGITDDGYLIATPDSRLYAWLPESGLTRIADASYDSDAGRLTAAGVVYESGEIDVGTLGISGDSEDFELSATYRQGDWIKGTYAVEGGASRAFNGWAFTGFDRGADATALEGDWTTTNSGLSFAVDANGQFSGSLSVDSFDCDLSGALVGINPAFNLYQSTVEVDCALLRLDAQLILGIGDKADAPGGGDQAVALIMVPGDEVAVGVTATR